VNAVERDALHVLTRICLQGGSRDCV
jgi:hypothetical protein